MAERRLWNREELILAFNLYCKIPFSKTVKSNPKIIELANLIGRTPSSVAMKLGNFARFDPELKKRNISGLTQGSKMDEVVWNEFVNDNENLISESELLLYKLTNPTDALIQDVEQEFEELTGYVMREGKEKERMIKTRLGQNFFRTSVLASYDNKCCITGIDVPPLLTASHIVPWSQDLKNSLNPQNGLCLNSLHDKAFDRGLITITPEYKVLISDTLRKNSTDLIQDLFVKFDNTPITLPDKFVPHSDFLKYHNEVIFSN